MLGNQVASTLVKQGDNKIDVANLPKGIYLIEFSSGKGIETRKLTISQ
jgi:hypothetical protein